MEALRLFVGVLAASRRVQLALVFLAMAALVATLSQAPAEVVELARELLLGVAGDAAGAEAP